MKCYLGNQSAIAVLFGVMFGGMAIATAPSALANPSVGSDDPIQSSSTLPPLPVPQTPQTPQTLDFQAPTPAAATSASPTVGSERYLVYVNGDSPLMLEQVKRLIPGAFRSAYSGQSVIQAGVFSSPTNAQAQVEQLAAQGITAQVAAMPTAVAYASTGGIYATGGTAVIPYGAEPPTSGGAINQAPPSAAYALPPARTSNYLVIIPGASRELPLIAEQVSRLLNASTTIPVTFVRQRDVPRGSHIAVGPFAGRGIAERWKNYFRDFGLDARVFYGR